MKNHGHLLSLFFASLDCLRMEMLLQSSHSNVAPLVEDSSAAFSILSCVLKNCTLFTFFDFLVNYAFINHLSLVPSSPSLGFLGHSQIFPMLKEEENQVFHNQYLWNAVK